FSRDWSSDVCSSDLDRSERPVQRGWEHENTVVNRIHIRTGRTLAFHITTQTDVTVQTAGETHIHVRAEVDPDVVGIGIVTILIGFENSILMHEVDVREKLHRIISSGKVEAGPLHLCPAAYERVVPVMIWKQYRVITVLIPFHLTLRIPEIVAIAVVGGSLVTEQRVVIGTVLDRRCCSFLDRFV